MKKSHFLQGVVGLVVTCLFVWLIARKLDWADVKDALAGADPRWVATGVAMFFFGYAARVRRWQLMLQHNNPSMTWAGAFAPFWGSIAVNNLVPFRAGDALRAFGFTKWLNQNASNVLATLLVERLLDLLTLLLAFGLALLWFGFTAETAGRLVGLGSTGLLAVGGAVLALLLKPRLMAPAAYGLVRLAAIVSKGLGQRIGASVDRVFDTLLELAHGPRMIVLVFWAIVAWSFEALVFSVSHWGFPRYTRLRPRFWRYLWARCPHCCLLPPDMSELSITSSFRQCR